MALEGLVVTVRHRVGAGALILLVAGCGSSPNASPPASPSPTLPAASSPATSAAATPPAGYADAYCAAVAAFDASTGSLRDWGAEVRAGDAQGAAGALAAARASLDEMAATAAALPPWAPADTIPRRLAEAVDLRRRLVDDVTGATGALTAAERISTHGLAARGRAAMYRAAASWDLVGGIFGTAPCPTDPATTQGPIGPSPGAVGLPAGWRAVDLGRDAAAVLAELPDDDSPATTVVRALVADVAGRAGDDWLVAVASSGTSSAYAVGSAYATDDPYQALADAGELLAPIGTAGAATRADFTIGPVNAIRIDSDTADDDESGATLAATSILVSGSGWVYVVLVLGDLDAARTYVFDVDALAFAITER